MFCFGHPWDDINTVFDRFLFEKELSCLVSIIRKKLGRCFFSVVVEINHHKLSDLKQNSIIPQFKRKFCQNESNLTGLKSVH